MTDSNKLDLILQKIDGLGSKVDNLEKKTDSLKHDFDALNSKVDSLELRFDSLENKADSLERKMTGLSLHLENGTDKNIQLIAENFIELTKKLNQAIPVADKNLAYEVKVNYLIEEVQLLKKEVAELKERTA